MPGPAADPDGLGVLVRWLAWQPDPLPLHAVCPDAPDRVPAPPPRRAAVVRLPCCPGELPVSAWLELAAAGAASVTLHDPHAPLDPASLAAARTLLRSAAPDRRGWCSADEDAPARAPRRPRLGARARRRTPVEAAALELPRRALLAPASRARYGARGRAGTERGRLLAVLEVLGVPADAAVAADAAVPPGDPAAGSRTAGGPGAATPSGALLDAPGCTACGTCVRACPEGALALVDVPGTADLLLRQEVAACTGCARCVDLCPAHALVAAPADGWGGVLDGGLRDVARVATRACARCGAAFGGAASEAHGPALCPVCAFRRAHPFGSAAPAGAPAPPG